MIMKKDTREKKILQDSTYERDRKKTCFGGYKNSSLQEKP